MNKKDFFRENTSAELDKKISENVDSLLELKAKNHKTQERRKFIIWTSLATAMSAYFVWMNSKQDSIGPIQASLAEDLNDEAVIALEELDLDIDDETLDNIDIIEEWRDGDEQS